MPSGPPELHRYWCRKGPYDGEGDTNAMHYLRQRGYVLTKGWTWIKPASIPEPSPEDNKALNYLVWEWDFGDIEP